MKIIEKKNNIEIQGAKFATASRPPNLSKFLNFLNLTLIVGLPASGKSSLIKNLLNGTPQDNLYNNVFNSVYYISPSQTMDINLPEEKIISLSEDEPLEDILSNIIDVEKEENEEDEDDPHRVLIILDDAINYINTNKRAMNVFKKLVMNGRHILGKHSSVATWIVSQKVKSIPLQIRSQANQVFFFDSTKGEKEVIRDEFTPLDKKEGEELMEFVFDRPHNFLFINLFLPKNKRLFKNFNQLILEDFN
tara:strand:- start:1399 stop:2145 length:747 start_codon:yes stop_codon:yes gene_type:complete